MFNTLKKINDLLDKKSKTKFGFLFLALVIKSFLDGFGLGLIVPYLAAIGDPSVIFDHQVFQEINVYTKIDSSQALIIWMSIVLIGFFITKNIFSLYVMYYQSRLVFTQRALQGRALFEAYMSAPYSYHLEHNSAELDRNIRFESANVYSFVQNVIVLCSNVLLTSSIVILLVFSNWQITVGVGLFILIFSFLFLSFTGRYNKLFGTVTQESQLHGGQALKEGLSSIIEAKLYNIESFFPARYFKYQMIYSRATWRQSTLGSAPYLFLEVLAVGTMLGVIVVLTVRSIDLYSILPILALFSVAFIRMMPAVTAIVNSFQSIKFHIPAVDVIHANFQYFGLLTETDFSERKTIRHHIDFNSLTLKDVSFLFPSKKNVNVIDELNIDIKRGQAIGVTGPSGAGKTTLINLILGFLNPDSGEVCVNGKSIHDDLASWYALIGYVPQAITLVDASIKENVALGFEGDEIDEDKVWAMLKEANLDVFVKDLSEGLDTLIGENGIRLSGGQRQRLGLARALYRDPEVLVFDEATSALDVETEKKITHEIMELSGKRTLIIVAHRVSTIKDCDVIYYLKNGKIINSGNFSELMQTNSDFRTLVSQSAITEN